jgi:hypothetical protein
MLVFNVVLCIRRDFPALFRYIRGFKIDIRRVYKPVTRAERAAMKSPTRKEIREALNTVPMDALLGVQGQLTHKQKKFARLVAQGNTASDAYREAYDTQAKPATVNTDAHNLRKNPKIALTIEAMQLAQEAAAYQTPAQLRALVIHSLVQTVIDPDVKAATKVQAAKVLGTVTEVAAFTERREVRTVKTSEDAKTELMSKLRGLMMQGATDAEIKDVDSLIREISADSGNDSGNEATPENLAGAERDPHTPGIEQKESHGSMHSIPHTHTPPKSTPLDSAASLESELMETPPGSKT